MPKYLIIILFVIFFLSAYWYFTKPKANNKLPQISLNIKNSVYNLEVAKSSSQKSVGLSNRKELCSTCGMIFVFSAEGIYPFWMKDTLIPLDMIWINKQGQVVSIHTATPQPDTPLTNLTIYQNDKPALYVIELNSGSAQKIGLNIGDTLNIPNL